MWVADPKAIHHILQGSSSLYEIPSITSEIISALTDRGLAAVVGEFPLISRVEQASILNTGGVHNRQRRAMAPAFGLVEAKALYFYFNHCANSVSRCSTRTWSLMSGLIVSSANSSPTNGTISSQRRVCSRYDYQCAALARQSDVGCVRQNIRVESRLLYSLTRDQHRGRSFWL